MQWLQDELKLKGESECEVKSKEQREQKCDAIFVDAREPGTGKGGNKTKESFLLYLRNLEHLRMPPGCRRAQQAQTGSQGQPRSSVESTSQSPGRSSR